MKKVYLFMLMAVGLLISASMFAMPERPVPPEPKAPEGVEMQGMPIEATNLPQPNFNKVPAKVAKRAPMAGDVVKIVRSGVDIDSYTTLEAALEAALNGDEIVLLSNVQASNAIAIGKSLTINLGSYMLQPAPLYNDNDYYYYTTAGDNLHWYFLNFLNGANVTIKATQDPSTGDWGGIFVPEYCYYQDPEGAGHWYYYYGLYLDNGASVVFESGWMQGGYRTVYCESGSEFTTSADLSTWSSYSNSVINSEGNLTINGGLIIGDFMTYGGIIKMTAGQISGQVFIYGGEMNVSGGEISYDGADYYTILIYTSNSNGSTATLNVTGGTFKHSAYSCIWKYSGNLNITGGTFDDTESQLPGGYIWFDNGDGTYTVKKSVASVEGSNDTFETLADAVAAAPANGKISLLYDITEDVIINKPITLNTTAYPYSLNGKVTADGAKVAIMGDGGVADFEAVNGGQIEIVSGTFTKNPADYLARNSKIVEGTTYTVVHSVIRVEISEEQTEYFSDLKSAFDYVQNLEGDNYVIDVLEDFEFKVDNGKYITLNKGKNITLNLNGHHVHGIMDAHETITSWAEMIYVTNGHFIVEDLSGDETGIMSFEQINPEPKTWYGNYMINVQSGATFTLKSGTLINNTKHSTFAIAVSVEVEGGIANIEGGKILGVNSTSCIRTYEKGTLNISGGYLSTTAYHVIFIQQSAGAANKIQINITGGEFEHLGGGHAISCFATNVKQLSNCTVNINGGKFDSRAIGFFLSGDGYHWGGTAWNRDDWNSLYRELFHATSGYFAVNTFYIEGTNEDESTVVYTPYLSEILDPEYDLFEQDNENYPYYVGPKDFTESTGNGNWDDLFPDSEAENIKIEHQVTVIEGYTEAYSLNVQSTGEVIVKKGATLDLTWGLVMEDGAKMTIEPGATVKVGVAGIQNTSNSFIVVQTDLNNSAILSIDPEAFLFSDPYIRVEYTTAAYRTTKNEQTWYKWQDFGIPTRKAPNFVAVEPTTWIMRWNVENGEYENVTGATLNEPFRGYIITNQLSDPGFTYIMTGRMNAAENQKFNFAVTGNQEEKNFNFFANSYLTPMDIKTFLQGLTDEDDNIERTVHVFNSSNDTYESVNIGDLKFGLAGFTTIAPMQAFYMSTKNKVAAQATLNYRNSIWGQTSTEPMHAPQRVQNDANVFNLYAGTGNAKDKLSFIESSNFTAEYENGYDAVKYMNKDFNIFVTTERGKQSIVATDNIEGTILTFQAGDAVEYQLSFDRVQCDEYSIMDLMTGRSVDISEGNTYNFVAEPKSTETRFQIIPKTPWVATGVDEVSGKTNSKGIYTILGQYVGSSAEWDKLSAGVYIVDGIKIVK